MSTASFLKEKDKMKAKTKSNTNEKAYFNKNITFVKKVNLVCNEHNTY